ncbi:MAG: long-chain fatty acid--CoA ligase [Actinomycetota bacterium]|nr:long-chain fatty acid--CoA ligase [Actinomycetota bacterium]
MVIERLNLELTIPAIFDRLSREYGDKVAVRQRRGENWVDYSWDKYRDDVRNTANGLLSLGMRRGDKVSILGINSYEWVVSDYAVMSCEGVSVPLYITARPEQLEYVVQHSDSRFLVVQGRAQLDRVGYMLEQLPSLEKIILMRPSPTEVEIENVVDLDEVKAAGREYARDYPRELDVHIWNLKPGDLMSIMYTSGTTGPPKGVMLTHYNAAWTVDSLNQCFDFEPGGERILSYLPLSHIAERNVTCFQAVINGYLTHFGEGVETLRDDLLEARPTVMFGVPRVWEKLHEALRLRFAEEEGMRRRLIDWALKTGGRKVRAEQAGQEVGSWLSFKYGLADRLVFAKIRGGVGLDKIKIIVSSAAPIYRDILEFFHTIGIPIREVYGQTEDTGLTTIHRWNRIKLGTVGQPIPGSKVTIADDGEILVRGGHVFKGYFKDSRATEETLRGGWLHSGDVGVLDENRFLVITDHKKDLIITAGGKNIAPQNIENLLKSITYVSQAVVIGDRREFLTAIITLERERVEEWAEEEGIAYENYEELVSTPGLRELIAGEVERVNAGELSRFETIKDFRLLLRDLTIENGELTPTLKVRRGAVMERYGELIEGMYADLDAEYYRGEGDRRAGGRDGGLRAM